ncbi:MAG: hypothetical protein ACE360_11280 [Hyphomicrobiales bacterium]
MSDTDTINEATTAFEPTVFPSKVDMAAWNAMTPEQQRAAIMAKVKKGLDGSAAQLATKAEIMAELRAERGA